MRILFVLMIMIPGCKLKEICTNGSVYYECPINNKTSESLEKYRYCLSGVSYYIMPDVGITVAYNRDGTIKTCEVIK